MLLTGDGIQIDKIEAVEYLKIASEKGNYIIYIIFFWMT